MYDVAAKFKLRAEANQLQIAISPPQSTLVITSDIGKLDRVLSNLIDNAIRHTEASGVISLVLEEHEGYAHIKVNDTGIGISELDLQHIFDASFQAKNSNSNRKFNAGLGLAITSELIKILKGRISVASALNEGSQFTVILPLNK